MSVLNQRTVNERFSCSTSGWFRGYQADNVILAFKINFRVGLIREYASSPWVFVSFLIHKFLCAEILTEIFYYG